MVPGFDPAPSIPETGPVVGEVRLGAAEPANDRSDAVVDHSEAIDDVPVVLGVTMIVGVAAGPNLPVVTHPDELRVPGPEVFVGRGGIVASVGIEGELSIGLRAAVGGEDQVGAAHDCVAGRSGVGTLGSARVDDLAAQAELEEEWAGVHGRPI